MTIVTVAVIFSAVAMALGFLVLVLWMQLDDLRSHHKYLENRLDDCVKRWELEHVDGRIKADREKLEALEAHFGIRFAENTTRFVVKKLLEK